MLIFDSSMWFYQTTICNGTLSSSVFLLLPPVSLFLITLTFGNFYITKWSFTFGNFYGTKWSFTCSCAINIRLLVQSFYVSVWKIWIQMKYFHKYTHTQTNRLMQLVIKTYFSSHLLGHCQCVLYLSLSVSCLLSDHCCLILPALVCGNADKFCMWNVYLVTLSNMQVTMADWLIVVQR